MLHVIRESESANYYSLTRKGTQILVSFEYVIF